MLTTEACMHDYTYLVIALPIMHCTEKPRILDGVTDVLVTEGSDAVLQSRVTGDPELTITWTRQKDFIPEHR